MGWIRKRRHPRVPPPVGPTPAEIELAAREAAAARHQLNRVEAQAPEVETKAQGLERRLRENNIGPRFWAALGEKRA